MSEHPNRDSAVLHEVDGIQEEDNKLPRWWLATLFLAMVFSFFYWEYYHVLRVEGGPRQQYTQAKAAQEKARALAAGTVTDEQLVAASRGHEAQEGAAIFASTCAACHGNNAEGKIGPNLTDNYWLHGGKPTQIYNTVSEGFVLKGMPSWKAALGPKKIEEVVAYVLTLRGKNAQGGKGPEGAEYVEGAPAAGKAAGPGPGAMAPTAPAPGALAAAH